MEQGFEEQTVSDRIWCPHENVVTVSWHMSSVLLSGVLGQSNIHLISKWEINARKLALLSKHSILCAEVVYLCIFVLFHLNDSAFFYNQPTLFQRGKDKSLWKERSGFERILCLENIQAGQSAIYTKSVLTSFQTSSLFTATPPTFLQSNF